MTRIGTIGGFALGLGLLTALAVAAGSWGVPEQGDDAAMSGTLPYARGETFQTLDAYLAHLQELGTMDIPYYERMTDGRYQLVIRRRPGQPAQIFTRAELAEKYGFAE